MTLIISSGATSPHHAPSLRALLVFQEADRSITTPIHLDGIGGSGDMFLCPFMRFLGRSKCAPRQGTKLPLGFCRMPLCPFLRIWLPRNAQSVIRQRGFTGVLDIHSSSSFLSWTCDPEKRRNGRIEHLNARLSSCLLTFLQDSPARTFRSLGESGPL